MAEVVRLIEPEKIQRNPENPRLIFRQEELDALQESIAEQGILVPLTLYQDGNQFYLLDGERRWRSALKLGLSKVPVIIQPKPDRMQNLMMMFAIHKSRKDWDPLPTALKLADLEKEYARRNGKKPTEAELAGIASLSRGEVRRLKKLLGLPSEYRKMLLNELEKPRSLQVITVDHVIEATKGAEALKKRGIIDDDTEDRLRKAIIEKFQTKVIGNTVDPRKLVRLAQSVERSEIPMTVARNVIHKLITDSKYSIDIAFAETVEQADFEHNLEQLIGRIVIRLDEHKARGYLMSPNLRDAIGILSKKLKELI
ncbi:MAG: ParB/RepB/Spo0J family partition protein [Anaerolineales bacterium]